MAGLLTIRLNKLQTWNQAFQINLNPLSDYLELLPEECYRLCVISPPVKYQVGPGNLLSHISFYIQQTDPREFTYLRMVTSSCQPTIQIGHIPIERYIFIDDMYVCNLMYKLPYNGSLSWKSTILDFEFNISNHAALCQSNITLIAQVTDPCIYLFSPDLSST